MKVAFLTTDNREQQNCYDLEVPFFGTAPDAILEGLKSLPDELEIHVISCSKRKMISPEMLAPNIYFHQPIVPHIGWGRTGFAGCALAVRRLLKKIKPDIVHGQGTERDCAISAVYSGFPNVLTIHGNMKRIYEMRLLGANSYYWLASRLETHALGKTSGVFCNSKHTQSLVGKRTQKTWLVPNPLRPSFLEKSESDFKANPIPVLLVVGVVTNLKRPFEILQTAKNLFEAGHRFKIQFIGSHSPESAYGAKFQKLLNETGQKGFAEYLGLLDETELIKAMDDADAMVHFPAEEAFGLVVAEAISRGLRFFGARVGGIPDIVEGVHGASLSNDFSELEDALADWLGNGNPPCSSSLELMRSRYHPEVVARRHLEIYEEVASGNCD